MIKLVTPKWCDLLVVLVFHQLGLVGCAADSLERMDDVTDPVHWCPEERPAHVVVSDALPPKCAAAMAEAVAFWQGQGVGYLTLAVVPDDSLTPGHPNPLFIQTVTTPPEDPGATGDTRIHRYSAGCIDSAEIRLDPSFCNGGNTQAHELGHALGLAHSSDKNNLMWRENHPGKYGLTAAQREQVR